MKNKIKKEEMKKTIHSKQILETAILRSCLTIGAYQVFVTNFLSSAVTISGETVTEEYQRGANLAFLYYTRWPHISL